MEITDDLLEFINNLENFQYFAENYLKIKDERGEIIPLKLNKIQLKVNEIVESLGGKPIRIILLKPRQTGLSTYVQAKLFHRQILNDNQKALTVGHMSDASNNLYDMYKRYYDNLPSPMQIAKVRSNEKKIAYKTGSENKIATAGAGEIGRSDTLQYLHLTEAAFYTNADEVFTALLQGAKYAKGIFIESTANGIGNLFHTLWVKAIEGNTESTYIPIFFSWIDFIDVYLEQAKNAGLDFTFKKGELARFKKDIGNPIYNSFEDEEKNLLDMGADYVALRWRRWSIEELCKYDVEMFHQEYPTTWQEAFVSSGKPVFNTNICQKNKLESKDPINQGDLEYTKDNKDVIFVPNPRGNIKIYRDLELKPNQFNKFACGWDVAEGLEQGDYSYGAIIDRSTMDIPITWHGHIDPDLLAEEQHKMSLWLKGGTFGTEVNNHGLTTVVGAFKLNVNQYYRQDFRKGYDAGKMELGWKTNIETKPKMIDDLNEYIREGLLESKEMEFWDECLTYVKDEKGRMNAQGKQKNPGVKCYDDRVMGTAVALQVHKWMPPYKEDEIKIQYGRKEFLDRKETNVSKF